MFRISISSFCVGAVLALSIPALYSAQAPSPSFTPAPAPVPVPGCDNTWDRDPLVVYDISGYTLTGALHRHLSIYSDGTATISSVSGIQGSTWFPASNKADFTFVGADIALKTWSAVRAAGALNECDSSLNVSDVPLQTVTVFRGSQNQSSRTYNYLLADTTAKVKIEQILNDFIQQYFPNF